MKRSKQQDSERRGFGGRELVPHELLCFDACREAKLDSLYKVIRDPFAIRRANLPLTKHEIQFLSAFDAWAESERKDLTAYLRWFHG